MLCLLKPPGYFWVESEYSITVFCGSEDCGSAFWLLKIALTSRSRCLTPHELQALGTSSSQLPDGMDTVPVTEQMKASQHSVGNSRYGSLKITARW